jgi:uncharacterized protein (DUF488 family)
MPDHGLEVLTVGHSTRSLDEFLALLRENGVTEVVDIRSIPRSRHNPQFNRDALPDALAAAGIKYRHLAALGGLRHPHPDSPNTAWTESAFRAYADYMETPEFEAGLEELLEQARHERVAIMCAEAVPWRCHRRMVGDALLARGAAVTDLFGPGHRQPHELTAWGKIEGGRVTYRGGP